MPRGKWIMAYLCNTNLVYKLIIWHLSRIISWPHMYMNPHYLIWATQNRLFNHLTGGTRAVTPAAAGDGRSTLGLEGTRIVCPQLGRRVERLVCLHYVISNLLDWVEWKMFWSGTHTHGRGVWREKVKIGRTTTYRFGARKKIQCCDFSFCVVTITFESESSDINQTRLSQDSDFSAQFSNSLNSLYGNWNSQ